MKKRSKDSRKNSTSRFFCIECGNEGIPLMRNAGMQRGKGHYKNMYCIHCKKLTGHYECRTEYEVNEFKLNFADGVYKEDAAEISAYIKEHYTYENSASACGHSGQW